MLYYLTLINFGSFTGFVIGLINPRWVLIGEKRTRAKSSKLYFGIWLASFVIIGMTSRQSQPQIAQTPLVTAKTSPILTPKVSPIPISTPEKGQKSTQEEAEISEPIKHEQRFDDEGNRGYRIERTETHKFKQPDGKIRTVNITENKTVSNGFIETKTETDTDINGVLTKRTEIKTETADGATIETKNTNEWGITTTDKSESTVVSDEFRETLALTPRQYKADPEIQPEPEPTEAIATIQPGSRCADFATQADAQAALPTSPRLDRNDDGVACESYFNGGGGGGGSTQSHRRRKR